MDSISLSHSSAFLSLAHIPVGDVCKATTILTPSKSVGLRYIPEFVMVGYAGMLI
jgi:hypothetical protein